MNKYTVNVEYTIYIPDDEFDENEDPIEEIEDYYMGPGAVQGQVQQQRQVRDAARDRCLLHKATGGSSMEL
jgi:hypothetical protein